MFLKGKERCLSYDQIHFFGEIRKWLKLKLYYLPHCRPIVMVSLLLSIEPYVVVLIKTELRPLIEIASADAISMRGLNSVC